MGGGDSLLLFCIFQIFPYVGVIRFLYLFHIFSYSFCLSGLPQWLSGKKFTCNAGHSGSGRYAGIGNGNPLRYSCLGNPMDRGVWWATVQGARKRVRHDLATKQQFCLSELATCFFVFCFFHLPVGLSDLNIFHMPLILLWGEEGAQNIPCYRFGIHFLSVFPIEGHPNLDPFGQRVFCLLVFHRKEKTRGESTSRWLRQIQVGGI